MLSEATDRAMVLVTQGDVVRVDQNDGRPLLNADFPLFLPDSSIYCLPSSEYRF